MAYITALKGLAISIVIVVLILTSLSMVWGVGYDRRKKEYTAPI